MLRLFRPRRLRRWLRSLLLRLLRPRWRQSGEQRETALVEGSRKRPKTRSTAISGRYAVTFQHLENELVQLASLALDPMQSGHGRHAVANLEFRELVKKTRTSVGHFLDEYRGAEPEFLEDLGDLLDRCGELADHRNKVVRSTYLFLESGDALRGIVRSDMRRGSAADEVELDQKWLEEGSFDSAMEDIAEVAFGIGQRRIQLIHWYGAAPPR